MVLANGHYRARLVKGIGERSLADLVDCIVAMPLTLLFYPNTCVALVYQ